MFDRRSALVGVVVCVMLAASIGFSGTARADSTAGGFIGGLLTAKVLSNMERRTQAQEAQASQPQPVRQAPQQAPQQAPATLTPQQQLQQLDQLAAGGYVTPDEYKARKKAIMDRM